MRYAPSLVLCLLAVGCSAPAPTGNCSVKDNGDGTATITCPDGTTVTVHGGTDGTAGTNGTNGTNGGPGDAGLAGTSCSVSADLDAGTRTVTCTDGTSVTLHDGSNGVDANAIVDFALLSAFELENDDFKVVVQSVSNVPRPVVRYTVRNIKGEAVKNIPASHLGGIALLQLVPGTPVAGGNGLDIDTWISHMANCATCVASSENATSSSLVDNGDGSYVYTFVKDVVNPVLFDGGSAVAGVAFDGNAPHRFAMRLGDPANDIIGQKVNSYRPVDVVVDYVPATGQNIDGQNDKVNVNNCLTCHTQFRAGALNIGGITPFHGGQRYDVRYCVVCHNDQRKYSGTNIAGNSVISEPTIDVNGNMSPPLGKTNVPVIHGEAVMNLPVFIHKIHSGENLFLKGNYIGVGTDINEFNFPQDLRNCTKCHSNAAKAGNFNTKPSRRACGSCHDDVDFVTGQNHNPVSLAQSSDNACNICHTTDYINQKHQPVARPDPTNVLQTPGGNANTNASWVGNTQNAPDGGRVFTYDIAAVTTTDGGPTGVFPQVKFRFKEGDAGVLFNAPDGGNELLPNFIGGPSVYCAFAMPQDGIAQPADFNVTMSGYLRNLYNGTASGTGAGNVVGPDSQGYYVATLTGARVPAAATMLTCGLGYTYALPATIPLTQVNLPAFPFDGGTRAGGLSLPARVQWKVAAGYIGRRGATASNVVTGQIVARDRCGNCHNELGITPNYHAGQRNDPATCNFCHTQNKTSSGWTAGSESFIHAIHAAKKRTVPFNWHAVAATEDSPFVTGFWGVEYPGRLNACESCHNPGMYDYSNAWYTPQNVASRLVQTTATGKYDAVTPTADGGVPALAISVSPYVNADGGVDYGVGYGYNVTSQVITPAALSTLVISPIANNCFGCHDDPVAKLHMENNGATIYGTRAQAAANVEQCLVCHGPGRVAAIKEMHSK